MTPQSTWSSFWINSNSTDVIYVDKAELPDDPGAMLEKILAAHPVPDQTAGRAQLVKLAVISLSDEAGIDLDCQIVTAAPCEDEPEERQACDDSLAGIALFALKAGLVCVDGAAEDEDIEVRVRLLEGGSRCDLLFDPGEALAASAETGQSLQVFCLYHGLAGAVCGGVIPTGFMCDDFDGVRATCVDNGVPMVCLRAEDFGLSGHEAPDVLNKDEALKDRLEAIRRMAGRAMGLADVSDKLFPQICLASAPATGADLNIRIFSQQTCQQGASAGAAIAVATAALYTRSAIHDLAITPDGLARQMRLAHPAGQIDVLLALNPDRPGIDVIRAGVVQDAHLVSTAG